MNINDYAVSIPYSLNISLKSLYPAPFPRLVFVFYKEIKMATKMAGK